MSIYRVAPLAVVSPADEEDVCALIELARNEGVSLTARGGGSGTGGAALGDGIVVDFGDMSSLWLPDDIARSRVVEVEPGVRHNTLQTTLAKHGLFLPAQPSSSQLSLIGGNIATKAAGTRALRYGAIDRWLVSLRCVAPNWPRPLDSGAPATIPAELLAGLNDLRDDLWRRPAALRRLEAKRGLKCASGYNLFPLLNHPPGAKLDRTACARLLSAFLVGSVGTLGLITRAQLRCRRVPRASLIVWALFADIDSACAAAPHITAGGAASVELVDSTCLRIAGGLLSDHVSAEMVLRQHPDSTLLLIELLEEEDDADALTEPQPPRAADQLGAQLATLQRLFTRQRPLRYHIVSDEEQQRTLRRRRAQLLFAIRSWQGRHALAVVNDIGVPPDRMAHFIARARHLFATLDLPAPIYGHAGSGNLHLRPLFASGRSDLRQQIAEVSAHIYALAIELGGTITAEHGMGPLRAPYLQAEWGNELYALMQALRRLLDREGLLNPPAIFSSPTSFEVRDISDLSRGL